MVYSESDEFNKLRRCFANGKTSKWDAYKLLKARREGGYMDSAEFLKCLGILSESVGYFYSEDERVSWFYSLFKDENIKYSESDEFKKLWHYFTNGKIDQWNARRVLETRHINGCMSYDEFLKCSNMIESMSKRYCTVSYSTISSEDFLKIARDDILANFDSQARNFSDQYVLDKIYKSFNPRNRRPQENAEIDKQIDALIENYNIEIQLEDSNSNVSTFTATAFDICNIAYIVSTFGFVEGLFGIESLIISIVTGLISYGIITIKGFPSSGITNLILKKGDKKK